MQVQLSQRTVVLDGLGLVGVPGALLADVSIDFLGRVTLDLPQLTAVLEDHVRFVVESDITDNQRPIVVDRLQDFLLGNQHPQILVN